MTKFCELEYNLTGGAAIVATGPGPLATVAPLRNYERVGDELIVRSVDNVFQDQNEFRLRVGSWVKIPLIVNNMHVSLDDINYVCGCVTDIGYEGAIPTHWYLQIQTPFQQEFTLYLENGKYHTHNQMPGHVSADLRRRIEPVSNDEFLSLAFQTDLSENVRRAREVIAQIQNQPTQ
jgi:hypothetical protein